MSVQEAGFESLQVVTLAIPRQPALLLLSLRATSSAPHLAPDPPLDLLRMCSVAAAADPTTAAVACRTRSILPCATPNEYPGRYLATNLHGPVWVLGTLLATL